MKKIKEFIKKVVRFVKDHDALFTLLGYVLLLVIALSAIKNSNHIYVEVITVDSRIDDCGEVLPTEPWLFDEVEKFIEDKREIVSIDYEVDRDSEDHIFRTAVIAYKK